MVRKTLKGETPVPSVCLLTFFLFTLIPHTGLRGGGVSSAELVVSSLTKRTKEHSQKVGPGLWAPSLS